MSYVDMMLPLQLSSSLNTPIFNTRHLKPVININHHKHPLLKLLPPRQTPPVLHSHCTENQGIAAIVFGDGDSETGLYPLIKRRSKGAIPIAANYRLVDAVISNCINSNINKIYAITQFNSTSLNSHFLRAYPAPGIGKGGLVEVIAACQGSDGQGWFQGTADSIRRCYWVFEEHPVSEFIVLPGHHLYRMDYQKVVEAHRNSGADITMVALSSTRDSEMGYGILDVNSQNQVTRYKSEPGNGSKPFISVETTGTANNVLHSNVPNTGIYVVARDRMLELLNQFFPKMNDFGAEIVPSAMSIGMKVHAYMFDGHWENMTTVGAFYRANMESVKKSNGFESSSVIYTLPRCLPPSTIANAVIKDSFIGDGCILDNCHIKGSVLGMRTRVESDVLIEDSVIMGSSVYQDIEITHIDGGRTNIPIGIGRGSQIQRAIVDKNARIGKNVMIMNRDKVEEGDRESQGYVISEGIVVVLRGAVISDNSIL